MINWNYVIMSSLPWICFCSWDLITLNHESNREIDEKYEMDQYTDRLIERKRERDTECELVWVWATEFGIKTVNTMQVIISSLQIDSYRLREIATWI